MHSLNARALNLATLISRRGVVLFLTRLRAEQTFKSVVLEVLSKFVPTKFISFCFP